MSKIKYLVLLLLFLVSLNSFSQTSWSYQVYFNLYDKESNKYTVEDFLNERIKIYSHKFGIHKNHPLYYNTKLEMFCFSQGTIATVSKLVFSDGDEVMEIKIPTHNLYFEKIIFESGVFCLYFWKDENIYNRDIKIEDYNSFYSPKKEISSYRCSEEAVATTIRKLEELEQIEIIVK